MSDPLRIAFVCTGNICRSPLAECLARHHLQQAGLGGRVVLESFGTHDYHVGHGADRRTIATAHRFGIDVSAHRARCIVANDCATADLVLAMDRDHERHLRRLLPVSAGEQIQRYLPFVGIEDVRDVPDPYDGEAEGFIAVHRLLDRAARRLAGRVCSLIADRDG